MAAVMAGMGVAEGAAVAVPWAQRESAGGQRPEQRWGTAAERSHEAAADATDATAGGGRSEHVSGKGELALDTGFPVQPLIAGAPSVEAESADPVGAPEVPKVKGFDPRTSREVTGERTSQGRTYRNTDGTYTTQYYDEPVNFRDEKGSWQSIDTSLTQPDGTRTMSVAAPLWETSSTEVTIGFAGHADADPVARLDLGEHGSVGFAVSGAAHSAGQVDGSTITYPDVRTSSDIEFLAGNASVKETLILKGPEAPTEWSFPLATAGLAARLEDSGAVVFEDAEGAERARIPQGWMEDSRLAENANEGAISTGVTYSLAAESGRQVLRVSLDQQWLHDPTRVFPVRVDPSVAGVSATSGTYVQAPYNTNFSTDTVLKTGTYDAGSHKAASFLHRLRLRQRGLCRLDLGLRHRQGHLVRLRRRGPPEAGAVRVEGRRRRVVHGHRQAHVHVRHPRPPERGCRDDPRRYDDGRLHGLRLRPRRQPDVQADDGHGGRGPAVLRLRPGGPPDLLDEGRHHDVVRVGRRRQPHQGRLDDVDVRRPQPPTDGGGADVHVHGTGDAVVGRRRHGRAPQSDLRRLRAQGDGRCDGLPLRLHGPRPDPRLDDAHLRRRLQQSRE
ncbi:hypothetical protein [Streptomyces sp. NBC_01451]|uniref:hypothetical protein n=1 Tax=Streptomyces sp. NBC_01451 TaxID=2903872 RepID=UPI003FCCF769